MDILSQPNSSAINQMLGGPTGHFPIEANIVGYLANSWSVTTLLGVFGAGWVVILGTTHVLVKYHNPLLGAGDKWAILWFVLSEQGTSCAFLSLLMPATLQRGQFTCSLKVGKSTTVQACLRRYAGYFAYNHARLAGMQDFFGQLWKEYSWSDSRYLTSDPFVLCMETVTAVCCQGSLDLRCLRPKRLKRLDSFAGVLYLSVSH